VWSPQSLRVIMLCMFFRTYNVVGSCQVLHVCLDEDGLTISLPSSLPSRILCVFWDIWQ
jgi:hypothetical protein